MASSMERVTKADLAAPGRLGAVLLCFYDKNYLQNILDI